MSVIDRPAQQRVAALAKANEVRLARAQLKRDVKAGVVDVRDVLMDVPGCGEGMTVWDLLMCIHKLGRTKVAAMLKRVDVPATKVLVGLSDRQRRVLVEELSVWSDR